MATLQEAQGTFQLACMSDRVVNVTMKTGDITTLEVALHRICPTTNVTYETEDNLLIARLTFDPCENIFKIRELLRLLWAHGCGIEDATDRPLEGERDYFESFTFILELEGNGPILFYNAALETTKEILPGGGQRTVALLT